jgi:hypothetical protein
LARICARRHGTELELTGNPRLSFTNRLTPGAIRMWGLDDTQAVGMGRQRFQPPGAIKERRVIGRESSWSWSGEDRDQDANSVAGLSLRFFCFDTIP